MSRFPRGSGRAHVSASVTAIFGEKLEECLRAEAVGNCQLEANPPFENPSTAGVPKHTSAAVSRRPPRRGILSQVKQLSPFHCAFICSM
jgi:hypothetical protein